MTAFYMTAEYVDPQSGEWVTENVLIDDAEVIPTEPFLPDAGGESDCPW